ncbi:MAG: hypothetical protein O7H41_08275 [Planctomycetota bacterium]|nr:hypothetical protein [Planctomycetota bacterium]
MGKDKKKQAKGKGKGRTKFLLAVFIVGVVGLAGAFTWKTGAFPWEGDSFKKFITFNWVK